MPVWLYLTMPWPRHIWGNIYPRLQQGHQGVYQAVAQKLEKDASNPQLIITRPGIGYMLVKPG